MKKSLTLQLSILFIFPQCVFGASNHNWSVEGRLYSSQDPSMGIYTSTERYGFDFHLGAYIPLDSRLNNEIDYGVAKPFYINNSLKFSFGLGALGSDLYTDQKASFSFNQDAFVQVGYRFHFNDDFTNRNEIYFGLGYLFNNGIEEHLEKGPQVNDEKVDLRPENKITESRKEPHNSYFEVSEVVRFNTNSSNIINPKPLGLLLEELSSRNLEDLSIVITGHADSTGPKSFNQDLSERRAKEVSTYFESFKDVKVNGVGESQPIAPNSTSKGRALNRRVHIEVNGKK